MTSWWVGVLLALVGGAAATTVCPQHCSCFTDLDGYISANCSTLALGAVEPSSVELLSLQPQLGGYPTKLAPRAFLAFQKIKFLWAINCSVLNLPTEVFHRLQYVIRIDLSYNKIRHLNGGVFKNLGSLTTLKLRGNPLELTPWDVVVSDSLQELDLGYCGLRAIPYGTFASLPRLSRLYLDGNELRTFTYNTVPAGLRYLNLARNRISNVPTEVLSTMSYLRRIDLSKNPVNCTCNLLIMQDWFSGQGIILDNGVTCSEPSQYAGMRLSKINENELCTLEEVKRQRRINDIQSYRDSKSHRTHNMIHDPDFQSDQPSGQIYAEVLFHDDGTRGLTHMELSDKHYPPLPSDLSDENNKVVTSKQELPSTEVEVASPTQMAKKGENENSREELSNDEPLDMKDPDSHEEEITEGYFTQHEENVNTTNLDDGIPVHSKMPDVDHTTDVTNWEHTSVITSEDLRMKDLSVDFNETQTQKTPHEEMADEGYSPVLNVSEIITDEGEEGSGSELLDTMPTEVTKEEKLSTPTPETFTFPSSSSGEDYHYDANHDYSGEVSSTTESMTPFIDEGSGEGENETVTVGEAVLDHEDNETTLTYFTVDNTTDGIFNTSEETTSEDYSFSSPQYNTSSESPTTDTSTTDSYTNEEPISIIPWESSSDASSTDASSTESSSSNYTNEFSPFGSPEIISSSTEPQTHISSTEEPSSTVESFFVQQESSPSPTESPSSSTETPSSSSSGNIIPEILTISQKSETEELTTASPVYTGDLTTPTSIKPVFNTSSTSQSPDVQILVMPTHSNEVNSKMVIGQTKQEPEKGEVAEAKLISMTYVIVGLLVALVLLIATTVICRKVTKRPCASKKKVRLPQDTEANHGTEMQDMLLPKPPENGVKIISQNGTQNGKDVKEEEVPVLQKDWEEKPEPIETVTARMSILAGPQTPVFIHKTLA